jgi:hypothetical protein
MPRTTVQSSEHKPTLNPQHDGDGPAAVGADARRQMIAEAAYFLAEHRGFNGGDPIQDWLAAEVEIDHWLAITQSGTPEEAAAYARLREEVRKAFSQVHDAIDAAAVKNAFERAMAETRRLENVSAEAMHKAAAVLREEMAGTAARLGPAWEHLSERSAGQFSIWKDRSRDFTGRAGDAVRHWLHREGQGPEH